MILVINSTNIIEIRYNVYRLRFLVTVDILKNDIENSKKGKCLHTADYLPFDLENYLE